METIDIILLILSVGTMCIWCFFIGAKVGQKVVNNEPIKAPSLNPIKAVEEYKDSKEYKEEQEKINTMLDNINNYRPDGLGQKDIE